MLANSSIFKVWAKRVLIAMTILVGLILAVLVIAPLSAKTQSVAVFSKDESLRRGIDASAARWTALGGYYAPDYEVIATVNAARWTALAQHFGAVSRGRVADAARWTALGAHYAPDYEAIATVNAARWTALAQHFTESGGRVADAARWNALGAHYVAKEMQDLQRGIEASTARYSAIAQYYAAAAVTR